MRTKHNNADIIEKNRMRNGLEQNGVHSQQSSGLPLMNLAKEKLN